MPVAAEVTLGETREFKKYKNRAAVYNIYLGGCSGPCVGMAEIPHEPSKILTTFELYKGKRKP